MTTNIHRLLDEAFASAASSTATQDLKEELRTNLTARVAELVELGSAADEAARRAFDELGDVTALVAETASDTTPGWARHQVRPAPAFVTRAVVCSIVAAAALVVAVLTALGVAPGSGLVAGGCLAAGAVLLGVVTADALRQETTTHYPVPQGRAAGYGVGVAAVLLGAGAVTLCRTDGPTWGWLVGGGALLLMGVGGLVRLGATQTNRTKPWALALAARHQEAADRFDTDPNAAARFGIYTLVVWVVAAVVAVVVGATVGWWWAALPVVAAFVAMMLLLTRMLFTPGGTGAAR